MIYTTALAEFFAVWALLFQLNLTMETLIPNTVSVHVKVTHFTMQNLTINPWGSPRKHCFPLSNAPVYASLFFVRNVEIAARLPLTFCRLHEWRDIDRLRLRHSESALFPSRRHQCLSGHLMTSPHPWRHHRRQRLYTRQPLPCTFRCWSSAAATVTATTSAICLCCGVTQNRFDEFCWNFLKVGRMTKTTAMECLVAPYNLAYSALKSVPC